MSDAFSTPAEHAFDHPELSAEVALAVAGPSSMGDAVADVALEEAFEVDQTVAVILNGGYKTIGLQFPDELLPSSVSVFKAIQTRIAHTGAQAYVLADSTYGSCCPDVLSCLHLPADLLVHYGHTCLTPTDALPVHYVFPRRKLDISDVVQRLRSISEDDFLPGDSAGKGLIVVWDVAFDWLADSLVDRIRNDMPFPTSFSRISLPDGKTSSSQDRKGKAPALRTIQPPEDIAMEDCVIWYIGEEGRSLVNMQMTHANLPLYAYLATEKAAKAIHPTTSRLLSRRLFAVHQAMSSDVFGLIVGNVGLASSQELLQQLRDALKKEKKKSYTLSVGRLNPAKLANFETIECFVLVGCAEGGVVDSKDFLRPIITPWEMLLALKGADGGWDPSKWTLDLTKVLEESHQARNPNDEDEKDDEPVFSLVTGSYRSRKVYGDGTENGTPGIDGVSDDVKSLTIRNNEFTLAKLESAGSHYLQSREFKGLEPRRGMDEPSALEEGRSGVARGYGEER